MFSSRSQFQSLTNLPCGLESNNNIATAGVSMEEEDASTDDDEHIRSDLSYQHQHHQHHRKSRTFSEKLSIASANGLSNGQNVGGGGGDCGSSSSGLEKFRIEYPKKYQNARSMSLSMERNAFCEMCRVPRSPGPFDVSGVGGDGGGGECDDDKGVPRYFGFTIRQYMALGSLALVDFLGFCSMSVMAPTFPKEVRPYYVGSQFKRSKQQDIIILPASRLSTRLRQFPANLKYFLKTVIETNQRSQRRWATTP